MLYLLGARNHPIVRAALGAVLLIAGIGWHGDVLLEVLGGVLVIWGTVASVAKLRRHGGETR